MSRRPLAIAALTAVLLVVAAGWWFSRPAVVPGVRLANGAMVRTLQFSGRVATLSRVEVGSTLTGRVVSVPVTEGARVRAGELLVRLQSDELGAALEQAQAGERQAGARLSGLRSTGRSAAQAAAAQTESVLVAASAEHRRTLELVAQGFVSQARLDDTRRAVEVARAQHAAALSQQAANADRGSDAVQAQAQLAVARSATAAARARLAQAELMAPADARVLSRTVEPGQIVQPGKVLLTLALAGPTQLLAQVDERFLQELQVGQSASVLADAFPGQRFEARVLSIAPLVDAQRGAVEVRFALPDAPPPFLREDMTLSIEVVTARRDAALVVPVAALRAGSNGTNGTVTVMVERDGRVQSRELRLGLRTLDGAEVLDGLAAGDVVLLGAAPAPGQRVRADLNSAPAPGAAGRRDDAGAALTNSMGR